MGTVVPKAKRRRDAMVGCRVSQDLKDAWTQYCKRVGVSETAAIEQLIVKELTEAGELKGENNE